MAGFLAIGGIFIPKIERYIICLMKCNFLWKSLIWACWPTVPPPRVFSEGCDTSPVFKIFLIQKKNVSREDVPTTEAVKYFFDVTLACKDVTTEGPCE